jgi:hypothetical protein
MRGVTTEVPVYQRGAWGFAKVGQRACLIDWEADTHYRVLTMKA